MPKPSRVQPSLFDPVPETPFVERVSPRPAPAVQRIVETSSGEKIKARNILAAITVLKDLDARLTPATPAEREALARFPGFGPVALSIFPNPTTGEYKPGWEEIGRELEGLVTREEYASAKRTVFSQFFTSHAVMAAMHQALSRLGVPDGATVLEPGCGVGNFMTGGHRYIGVELDRVSGRIARALHPDADIRIEDFQRTKLPDLDAVIGNPPFANVMLDHRGQKLALHDYFIAKSTDALKPGGVLAVVTSRFTMDKANAACREYLREQADFLGAIRLPSDAFKREGTQVVTDIVFLRKRSLDEPPRHAAEWLETATLEIDGATVPVNRYFLDHPEQVLGTWSRKDTLYGTDGISVTANGELADQLRAAVERLPRFESPAVKDSLTTELVNVPDKFTPPPPSGTLVKGHFSFTRAAFTR